MELLKINRDSRSDKVQETMNVIATQVTESLAAVVDARFCMFERT